MSKPSRPKRTAARRTRSNRRAQKKQGAAKRTQPRAETGSTTKQSPQMWSAGVTRGSNALDLDPNVFTKSSPRAIAQSLKRSAEHSRRRKAAPFQSAMSMLNFYINRAGRNLPKARLEVLQRAKASCARCSVTGDQCRGRSLTARSYEKAPIMDIVS